MAPRNAEKLTREAILERKRQVERLRYERNKNDPCKLAEMKEKERNKYKKKKEAGTRKLVQHMTPREHRATKKKWKEYSTKSRAAKIAMKEITNTFVRENTPESDSNTIAAAPQHPQRRCKIKEASEKKKKRAKKLRKKMMKEKDKEIQKLKKNLDRYRKRAARMKEKEEIKKAESPHRKLIKMPDTPESRQELVKKALFGDVLKEQLKENYSKLKCRRERRIFTKVISGSLVERYKLWRYAGGVLSYKRAKSVKLSPSMKFRQQSRRDKISIECVTAIRNYFEDDCNSRLGAGKKEFITRRKVRKQKRYLLDSMLSLHKKFVKNNFEISYQTFCRFRPFWVVKPNVVDRDTCLCITHANMDLKLSALRKANIICYSSYQKLLEEVCCDRYNEQCLAKECQHCINKVPVYKEFDSSKPLLLNKWLAEKQEYTDPKTRKKREVTKYLKKLIIIQPCELIAQLQEDLDQFLRHERNIVHQFSAMKNLKKNLTDTEAIVHMDFSENYCTKYGQEIQAFHFGGSRLQISLHTVVVYMKNSTQAYCTTTTNTSHSPAAIWVHLQPILKALPPQIDCLHFLSDGPVTQYRNKTMFYILACKLPECFPKIEKFTWNYSESGHGKGAPDGVGATCKRTADSVVAAGGDVRDLETFVHTIQQKCPGIILKTIKEEDIQKMTDEIQQKTPQLKSFNGTLRVHQATGIITHPVINSTQFPVTLIMRSLSCFCGDYTCEHFKIGTLKYQAKRKLSVEEVYSTSESDNEAGPSFVRAEAEYSSGTYVLVKIPFKKTEYRYVAVINTTDHDECELSVTFLKLCDNTGQMFKVDHKDVADVTYEQIIKKLPSPGLVKKGKRVFYKFKSSIGVFEK